MIYYLSSVYNNGEVPLSYAVNNDYMGDVDDMTREEQILYHASLNRPTFDQYFKKLMWLINELTIGIPEEACIKQVKCGRVDMQKLRQYYGGKY